MKKTEEKRYYEHWENRILTENIKSMDKRAFFRQKTQFEGLKIFCEPSPLEILKEIIFI